MGYFDAVDNMSSENLLTLTASAELHSKHPLGKAIVSHFRTNSNKTLQAMKTIKLNLTLSMLLNFVAIILAVTGVLDPVLGALVHNVGSVVVIINSALLLNFKSK